MKKTSLFLASLLVGIIVFFNSCEKEITSTALVVDQSKTAVLKLYLRADLDSTEGIENAPDGIVINASVKNNDLNPHFTGAERTVVSSTTAGGVVEFTLPTTDDGVTVYIEGNTFEREYLDTDTTLELRKYELKDLEYTIKAGGSYVERKEFAWEKLEDIEE